MGRNRHLNPLKIISITQSRQIDNLDYGYFINTNRLKFVNDLANDTTLHLGDFTEINNNTTQDYWYDGNGNMMQDKNNYISNFLNLPQTITVTGKGNITYTYDASGNKLQKITFDNTVTQLSLVYN